MGSSDAGTPHTPESLLRARQTPEGEKALEQLTMRVYRLLLETLRMEKSRMGGHHSLKR